MMDLWRCLAALFLAAVFLPTAQAGELAFTGAESCKGCHESAYDSWKDSHHYQAMLPATKETVLGNFSDQTFEYAGITSRFFRRDEKYFVETDNEKGELQEFEIAYTFGFYPLQQYLVPFPGGRMQALNIVWDSRGKKEGGQRWIHLYPDDIDDPVTHQDTVHWTGSFQNWNSRCAVCHSTGFEKNYSSASNSYQTHWKEINVSCEACHGPASGHMEWTDSDRSDKDKGFTFSLDDAGAFGPGENGDSPIFSRLDGQRPKTQVESCAACHARRSEMGKYHAGQSFEDNYRMALLEPGLYFPDGQIQDEVYVYGSFMQSKMFAAGVVCTHCHDPHSNVVRATDNTLCTQCHQGAVYDRPEHHRHEQDGAGAVCIDCHMPSRTYMVVDDRRDHGFRIPEPRLTLQLGVPNACGQCHQEKDAQWAITALDNWGVSSQIRASHAPVLASAWSGNSSALPELLTLAAQVSAPSMLRASAVAATANYPSQETFTAVSGLLASPDALIRAATVRSLDWLPAAQRYAMLRDLVTDDSKLVRMAVARQLSGIPATQLPGESGEELMSLRQEYLQTMEYNADMPEEQMNIALFYAASGDPVAAERAYRTALKLSPGFVAAMLNLADLFRANGTDDKALPLLQEALERAPEQAPTQHAMGLFLVRKGELLQALTHLQESAALEPQNTRYAYVYAVALWETGKKDKAVSALESALQRHPANRELISALASYYQELGEEEKLRQLMKSAHP